MILQTSASSFMTQFISSWYSIKFADIPLVFVSFALAKLPPQPLLRPEALAGIRYNVGTYESVKIQTGCLMIFNYITLDYNLKLNSTLFLNVYLINLKSNQVVHPVSGRLGEALCNSFLFFPREGHTMITCIAYTLAAVLPFLLLMI